MLVIGHRGASAEAPENTLEAFARAAALGADGVELDVRSASDGALVIHHDPAYPDGRPVAEVTAADRPPHVCTLAEALDACAGFSHINVEIKNLPHEVGYDPSEAIAAQVVAEVGRHDAAAAVVVSAFTPTTLDAVRTAGPVATALLVLSVPAATGDPIADIDRLVAMARAAGHQAINPLFTEATPELVDAAHDAGIAVRPWTVDDPLVMADLAGRGVDGIITNDVALALRTLGR